MSNLPDILKVLETLPVERDASKIPSEKFALLAALLMDWDLAPNWSAVPINDRLQIDWVRKVAPKTEEEDDPEGYFNFDMVDR